MITRIRIDGFKSLINTELHFGPFTCIVGANAIGKSNFFDALTFLSKLADKTVVEAAKSVRSENQKHSNIRDIFFRSGADYMKKMSFEIDMIISNTGIDDLGQTANATITSLRYTLQLQINDNDADIEPVTIVCEKLEPINLGDTRKNIFFDYKKEWLDSILKGRRGSNNPFISTDGDRIKLHQDNSQKGRSSEYLAVKMPRTLLSTVTSENPTAFLVRQEMRNWTMLQFEPSALRQPNSIGDVKNAIVQPNGLNLPAALYRLTNKSERDIFQSLTNKLKDLVDDVDEVMIDRDEKRDLLTIQLRFKDGLALPAQSLSDGTLRFLGLAIINEDSHNQLICLEEPENGINPKKIYDIVALLTDMASDTNYAVDESNPLRQIIINTHSPIVASAVQDDSLYLAKATEMYSNEFGIKLSHTCFTALADTWKTRNKLSAISSIGEILAYLDKLGPQHDHTVTVDEPQAKYLATPIARQQRKKTVAENLFGQMKLNF